MTRDEAYKICKSLWNRPSIDASQCIAEMLIALGAIKITEPPEPNHRFLGIIGNIPMEERNTVRIMNVINDLGLKLVEK